MSYVIYHIGPFIISQLPGNFEYTNHNHGPPGTAARETDRETESQTTLWYRNKMCHFQVLIIVVSTQPCTCVIHRLNCRLSVVSVCFSLDNYRPTGSLYAGMSVHVTGAHITVPTFCLFLENSIPRFTFLMVDIPRLVFFVFWHLVECGAWKELQ